MTVQLLYHDVFFYFATPTTFPNFTYFARRSFSEGGIPRKLSDKFFDLLLCEFYAVVSIRTGVSPNPELAEGPGLSKRWLLFSTPALTTYHSRLMTLYTYMGYFYTLLYPFIPENKTHNIRP